jgi:uncharacterized membrane protein YfcA
LFTVAGTGASYLVWVFSGSFWLFLLSRIVSGAFSGNLSVATAAVESAQRVQLPVALAATAVNFAAGRLDIQLGLGIGVLVLIGWAVGRRLTRGLPVQRLRQGVALALIATGLAYL